MYTVYTGLTMFMNYASMKKFRGWGSGGEGGKHTRSVCVLSYNTQIARRLYSHLKNGGYDGS
jgi:hypothetical protein